jgi:phosphomannomutase
MASALPLFGTAGARGPYPEKINPRLIYSVALAAARHIADSKGSAVVGHDSRLTSPLLSLATASGFMAGGMDVILIGTAPLPVVAYEVKRSRSSLGASISASHNPPMDNGIKLLKKDGMELFRAEESSLEGYINSATEVPWDRVGYFTTENYAVESYINEALEFVDTSLWRRADRPKVLVDCANGAASVVTPKLLREAGFEKIISVNCNLDGTFPGRLPEPRPDVMASLQPVLEGSNAEVLLAHDGDADRLAVLTRGLGFVKQDLIIALLAQRKLSESKGNVVVSVDVGYEVQEVVEKTGGKIVRAPLGRLHEYIDGNTLMAAEPWKLIDPKWGPWPDGIFQALLLLDEVMRRGRSVNEVILSLPSYPSARLSFLVGSESDKEQLYEALSRRAEKLLGVKVTSLLAIDGVRVEGEDGSWLLVRKSGTEMKVRVYAQATKPARLKDIIDNVKAVASSTSDRARPSVLSVEEAINMA